MDCWKRIKKVPKWSTFKKLQNETLLKATYIWFIIVPIATKLFSEFSSPFTFTSNGKEYALVLDLPFQWQMLYWASFCFIVSNILYRFFAPKIIQENDHWGNFEKSGKTKEHLKEYVSPETLKIKFKEYDNSFQVTLTQYETSAGNYRITSPEKITISQFKDLLFKDTWIKKKNSELNQERMHNFYQNHSSTKSWQSTFWEIYNFENTNSFKIRLLSLFLILISTALTLIVITEKIYFVIQYSLGH